MNNRDLGQFLQISKAGNHPHESKTRKNSKEKKDSGKQSVRSSSGTKVVQIPKSSSVFSSSYYPHQIWTPKLDKDFLDSKSLKRLN